VVFAKTEENSEENSELCCRHHSFIKETLLDTDMKQSTMTEA